MGKFTRGVMVGAAVGYLLGSGKGHELADRLRSDRRTGAGTGAPVKTGPAADGFGPAVQASDIGGSDPEAPRSPLDATGGTGVEVGPEAAAIDEVVEGDTLGRAGSLG
jgi:hypothetical protein